jgi:branched-chain amino acid aminotransferase
MTVSNSAFTEGVAYIDGVYVPLSEARIPILDRGFVRSDATYDVVHVWKGQFFRIDDHVERFFRSMAGLRLELTLTYDEVIDILERCVALSGLRDSFVEMICTRGVPPKGSRDPRECVNRFYAFAAPFVWIANEHQRTQGLKMIVSDVQRIPPTSIDPCIKNFHWLDLTLGTFQAYDQEATVPVLVDGRGNITEGPGFNVFSVRNGRMATPNSGIFEGMTRRSVIELAHLLDLPMEIRAVSIEEFLCSDEVFITSTAGGVMPVSVLNARPLGDGTPGPLSRRLEYEYWTRKESGWWSTEVDYNAV